MTENDKALVERLREMGEHPCRSELPMGEDLRQAADRIEALSAFNMLLHDMRDSGRMAPKIKLPGLTGEPWRKYPHG